MRAMAMVYVTAAIAGGLASGGAASAMSLTSPDIKQGGKIANEQVFNGLGLQRRERVARALMVGRAQGDEEFRRHNV